LVALREYLFNGRQLHIKPDTQINRSQRGVSYCGYRVLPGAILLNRRKRQRYQQLRHYWEQAWLNDEITELQLQQAYQSVHAITLHADSDEWRKQNLRLHPPPAIWM
jgi:RNA-directed DNA polymerase